MISQSGSPRTNAVATLRSTSARHVTARRVRRLFDGDRPTRTAGSGSRRRRSGRSFAIALALFATGEVSANADLVQSRHFVGVSPTGRYTANSMIGVEHSIRFVAERSGAVTHVSYENRLLHQAQIDQRTSEPFVNCRTSGLGERACGYTLGNSYHVGTGGRIEIEVRPDDGTAAHHPDERILLGRTAEPFVPYDNRDVEFPELELAQSAVLTEGALYHLVFRNLAPPPEGKLSGLSDQEARELGRRDFGAISLNGVGHMPAPDEALRYGPFHGRFGKGVLDRRDVDDPWTESHVTAWYALRYADDVWTGDRYAAYRSDEFTGEQGGAKLIGGSVHARQAFTLDRDDVTIDGVWVQYGLSRNAGLLPLTARLVDADGREIAVGTLNPDPSCRDAEFCRTWKHVEFDDDVTLSKARRYALELSAPDGAGYEFSTYIVHRAPGGHVWENARAEVSRDGGRSWTTWLKDYRPERDLSLMFTIADMPYSLPH